MGLQGGAVHPLLPAGASSWRPPPPNLGIDMPCLGAHGTLFLMQGYRCWGSSSVCGSPTSSTWAWRTWCALLRCLQWPTPSTGNPARLCFRRHCLSVLIVLSLPQALGDLLRAAVQRNPCLPCSETIHQSMLMRSVVGDSSCGHSHTDWCARSVVPEVAAAHHTAVQRPLLRQSRGGVRCAGIGRASSTACRTQTSPSGGAAWTCCLPCAARTTCARLSQSSWTTCRQALLASQFCPCCCIPP